MTSPGEQVTGWPAPRRFPAQAVAEILWNRWPHGRQPPRCIVLGNQKAGTSVVAGAIGEALDCRYQIDLPLERYAPTHQRRSPSEPGYVDTLVARSSRRFTAPVVKEPSLTFWWRDLADRWPSARLLFVVREPLDNVRSILDRLGLLVADGEQVRSAIPFPWIHLIELADAPVADRPHARTLDEVVIGLGRRWELLAAEAVAARDAGHAVIRYEDFVDAPDATFDRLGLPPTPPSVLRRSFQPRGANRGRDPGELLGPRRVKLLAGVAPLAEALGYSSGRRPDPTRRSPEPATSFDQPAAAARRDGADRTRSEAGRDGVGEPSLPTGKGAST